MVRAEPGCAGFAPGGVEPRIRVVQYYLLAFAGRGARFSQMEGKVEQRQAAEKGSKERCRRMIMAVFWKLKMVASTFTTRLVGETDSPGGKQSGGDGPQWFPKACKHNCVFVWEKQGDRVDCYCVVGLVTFAPSRLELYELSPLHITLRSKSASVATTRRESKVWTMAFMRSITATIQGPFLFCQVDDRSSVYGPHARWKIPAPTERWKAMIRLLHKLVTRPPYTDSPKMEYPNPAAQYTDFS